MDILPISDIATAIRQQRIEKFQILILKHAKKVGAPFYIDEIDFDSLLCGEQGLAGKHPSMIGIAVRILIQKGAISQTCNYRRSGKKWSKGRLIFEYKLGA